MFPHYITGPPQREEVLTLLDMGGGFLAPPFFKGQIVKKTLRVKKSKKMCIPLFMSLLCMLCFDFYQNRLICMQNEFEKTYPEGRSPKRSCHI
jgi:hypothetical protein